MRLVLLIFLLGLFFGGVSLAHEIDQGCVHVSITDSGFVPDIVSLPVGGCVTWSNEGTNLHWPASNFHPTHGAYPSKEKGCIESALDACNSLQKDESFSFVFEEPGTWGMHDHVYPGLVMQVKVEGDTQEEDPSFVQKVLSAIGKVFEGVREFFKNLFQGESVMALEDFRNASQLVQRQEIKKMAAEDQKKAWEYLKEAFIIEGQVRGNAHEHAHVIGNIAYQKQGFKGANICDNSFAYGCFHGVTKELLKEKGADAIPEVEETCLRLFPPKETMDYTGCIHGAGHGLFSKKGFDVEAALAHCDTFSAPYRNYCYDGVFMEHSFSALPQKIDSDDPWKFCTDLPPQYHFNCARYQTQVFTILLKWSLKETADACAKAPEIQLQETCAEDFGYMATQYSSEDLSRIRETCFLFDQPDHQYQCLMGAATEFVVQGYEGWQAKSQQLCDELPLLRQNKCLSQRSDAMNASKRTGP